MNILSAIFTGPFVVTIIRYALTAIGAWLVANGYLAEDTWLTVSGALLTIVMAFLGGSDSVRDKIVSHGRSVAVDKLPANTRAEIERAAQFAPKRNLLSILFGR